MPSITIQRPCVAALAALSLAACASGRTPEPPRAADPAPAASGADVRIGALGARTLPSGQCGLFLWTRAAEPELVFFVNPESGQAAVVLDGRERSLSRLAVEAPVTDGRAGAQTFASQSGDVSVRLTVLETEPVEGGYRVGSASLRFNDDKGWSSITPTVGLAACQP